MHFLLSFQQVAFFLASIQHTDVLLLVKSTPKLQFPSFIVLFFFRFLAIYFFLPNHLFFSPLHSFTRWFSPLISASSSSVIIISPSARPFSLAIFFAQHRRALLAHHQYHDFIVHCLTPSLSVICSHLFLVC